MTVWVTRGGTIHWNPQCRRADGQLLTLVEIGPEHVAWVRYAAGWMPERVRARIDGRLRSLYPCATCCPRQAGGYEGRMAWLVEHLGATPPGEAQA